MSLGPAVNRRALLRQAQRPSKVESPSANGTGVVSNGDGPSQPLPSRPTAEIRYVVSNELNRNLVIVATDGSHLVLAPLEMREIGEDEVERFALRFWPDVCVEEKKALDNSPVGVLVGAGIGFWFAIPWAIVAAFVGEPRWWILGWVALGGIFLFGALVDLARMRTRDGKESVAAASFRWVRASGGQQAYLALGILIGFALPAAAIFFAADAWHLIDLLRSEGVQNSHAILLTLIGRIMQVVFVAAASLTPALLFFFFDREHLDTLRDRFMRQIMRFDPTVHRRRDVLAKYGHVMDEAYGRDARGRILPGRRSPLLLATLLIALGWSFTLLHGDVEIISERGITSLFEPRPSAVSFAFLGAYFYGLNVVLRGYVRKDLRAKTYSTLTVRILVVVVLAWVLELVWQGTTLYLLVFLTGIFPETALVLIKETLRGRLKGLGSRMALASEETDPLTKLEGIDLYDLARLFDEGVTNVQGLAHNDVVDLMLQTRIPVPRILDWVDQAILYLHAGPATSTHGADRATTLTTLREFGIRTATDVDNAFAAAEKRGTLDKLTGILGDAGATPRLRVIKDALEDEEWMINLRHWRRQERVVSAPVTRRVARLSSLRPRRESNPTPA